MTTLDGLTITYEMWRFFYWQKGGQLSYAQIDEKVAAGEIVPSDEQVSEYLGE